MNLGVWDGTDLQYLLQNVECNAMLEWCSMVSLRPIWDFFQLLLDLVLLKLIIWLCLD